MSDKQKTKQRTILYHVEFTCREKTYKAIINEDMNGLDEPILDIQGISIRVVPECGLYIDNMEKYTDDQLSFLSFEMLRGAWWLTDYCLKMNVPIELIDRHSHKAMLECLIMEMKQDGSADDQLSCSRNVLTASSSDYDVESSLHEIQNQLKDRYILCTCACCKYGQGNPYCWDYFNYLCFRKNKGEYSKFPEGVWKTDWEFFDNKDNSEKVRPTFCCNQFESFFFRKE